jgi:hypothetical protein
MMVNGWIAPTPDPSPGGRGELVPHPLTLLPEREIVDGRWLDCPHL